MSSNKKIKKESETKEKKLASELFAEKGIEFRTIDMTLKSNKTPPTIAELEHKYKQGAELLKENPNDPHINVASLRFLAYGLDFIDFAKNKFGIELTLNEQDIETLEELAEQAHKAYIDGKISEDMIHEYAKTFAGYLGLLVIIHKGGDWIETTLNGEIVHGISQRDGNCSFVHAKAYRRLKNGSEDNLLHFYYTFDYLNNND